MGMLLGVKVKHWSQFYNEKWALLGINSYNRGVGFRRVGTLSLQEFRSEPFTPNKTNILGGSSIKLLLFLQTFKIDTTMDLVSGGVGGDGAGKGDVWD